MLGDIAFLIISGLAFVVIGSSAWRFATGHFPRGDQWLGIALPLGLGLSGTILGVFACTVSFDSGFAALLTIALLSFARHASIPASKRSVRHACFWVRSGPGMCLSLVVLILAFPGMFVPVIDGDALCYHLEVAKRMIQDNGVIFDPDLHETAYPLLVESLQAVALKCRGPIATRAISFWFGIALAFASACLAGSLVKGPGRYWASALILVTPVVHCGMISPLNDVALAALCTSSLAAWIATEGQGVACGRRFALAGTLCGFACGVKFPGIVWLAVMASYLATVSVRNEKSINLFQRNHLRHLMIFTAFVLIFGGFWYVRAAVLTGNPVHPYFRNTFGGHGLDEVLEDARKPLFDHFVNIATAPIGMAFMPSRFDSFSHQSGPLFLALIPLGFLLNPGSRWKSFVGLGWLLMALCLTQRQSPRFFLTTFALWSAAAAATISEIRCRWNVNDRQRRLFSRFAIGCPLLMAAFLGAFDLARVRFGSLILSGQISPHDWLEANEPTAKLREWVDSNLPPDAKLIGQDHRGYYWPRRFTMEKAHRRRTGLLESAETPEATVMELRLAGFSHLVMAEPDPVDAVEFDTDLSIRLASWIADRTPLLDVTLPEMDGYVRRYRIFDIRHEGGEPKVIKMAERRDLQSTGPNRDSIEQTRSAGSSNEKGSR